MSEDTISDVQRLPLWKACLDQLVANGISYGMSIPTAWLEEQLRCKRDTMRFGLDVSDIRRELEKLGFYLCGRGQNGAQFVVLQPDANADKMVEYQRHAMDALRRGVILGTNTRLDTLCEEDKRRHEAILERLSIRVALMQRPVEISKIVHEKKPKLLTGGR